MLIRRPDGTEPCFHTVGNAGQRAVVEQVRDIAPVTDRYLFPGIKDRCVFIRRVLQFDHAKRHTVDKQNDIRSAVFRLSIVCILDRKLIDCTEDILIRIIKVDQRHHARLSALRRELDPVDHPVVYFMQCGKIALRAGKADGIHDLPDFIGDQIRIRFAQKLFQIIDIQHIAHGISHDAAAGKILPVHGLQIGEKRALKFRLAIAAIVVLQFCHCCYPPHNSNYKLISTELFPVICFHYWDFCSLLSLIMHLSFLLYTWLIILFSAHHPVRLFR